MAPPANLHDVTSRNTVTHGGGIKLKSHTNVWPTEITEEYLDPTWGKTEKGKVKVTLEQAIKAQRGSRDIALLFL